MPLSLRRKWWIFALPMVGCVAAYALGTLLISPQNNAGWSLPLIAAIVFGCLAFGTASAVKGRGGWQASTIVGCVCAFIILSNALLNLSSYQSWGGEGRTWGMFAFVLIYTSLYFWLRRRERADRPWQFGALYKTSPVAAEQEYRLYPLVGLPVALFSCAGLIVVAVVLGW